MSYTPSTVETEDAFFEGILEGQRLQQAEDQVHFSRYREELDEIRQERDNARVTEAKYRDEVELLKTELAGVKDRLLAVQLAYEELSLGTVGINQTLEPPGQRSDAHQGVEVLDARTAKSLDTDSISSASSFDSWLREGSSLEDEDDEAFGVMQQLHLMDEWDKEDAEWAERIRREASEADKRPSSPLLVTELSEPELLSSPAISIVDLSEPERSSPSPASQNEPIPPPYVPTTGREPSPGPSRPVLASTSSIPSSTVQLAIPQIFVDASPQGIGLIFKDRWLAWTFTRDHPLIPLGPDDSIVMSWAELIAVELGLLAVLAAGYRNARIKVRSDNEGVVMALRKGEWTVRYELDDVLQRVLRLCADGGILLHAVWIRSKANPADGPSRGVYPPRRSMLEHRPEIPQYLVGLVQAVDPSTLQV